jgi:hypothetical protein
MFKAFHKLESEKGCTLIDLLIFITVIGIFADIAFPHFIDYLRRVYDSQALSDARKYYKACIEATLEADNVVSYGDGIMPPGYTGMRPLKGMFAWNPKWPTLFFCNVSFKHPKGTRIYNINAKGYISAV